MDVARSGELINVSTTLNTLLNDFSAVIDYRTLRDTLPQRLAVLLHCRYIMVYLRIDETLQLSAASAGEQPGWSADLLSVAHVNPISLDSEICEATVWRTRRTMRQPLPAATRILVPLIYRQRAIGVLVALRDGTWNMQGHQDGNFPSCWLQSEEEQLEAIAGVVALLLENTRLLEHDRDRIHELSLLNSISSQLTCSLYEKERLRQIVLQRTREITSVDLCALLEAGNEMESVPWVTAHLRNMLLQRLQSHHSQAPLVFERPGSGQDQFAQLYFAELPPHIMTFFVLPLFSNRTGPTLRSGGEHLYNVVDFPDDERQETGLVGCIIGAYRSSWKIRQSELALLHVLASQAGAVLENIQLVADVVEARNEARKLLRQVLDDKRLNALILESVPSGLITTDLDGRVHTFNRAASVILGYHPYEVLGQPLKKILDLRALRNTTMQTPLTNLIPLSQQGAFMAGMHAGEVMSETVLTTDRYDRELVLDVDVRPLYDDSSTHVGMLMTFIDVTSMHRLEDEKRRLDHLASLGEMAASVAHEVRNPLASIKTSIQMLQDDLIHVDEERVSDKERTLPLYSGERLPLAERGAEPSGASAWMQESIAVILKEVERLDCIVRDLLLFARPHQLRRIRCDIVELCEKVLAMVQTQCTEENIEIHRIFDDLSPIWVDVGQVEQVILNLYLNAIQAMPDGGILTVTCHLLSAEQAIYDTAGSDCPPTQRPAGAICTGTSAYARLIDRYASEQEFRVEHWLEILIHDTGTGIAPEQLNHIFQPFYTTKAHGIGLGLAITRRLIEDHGGYLRIESQYGYGTTIAVRLPFVTQAENVAEDVPDIPGHE